MKVKSRGYKRRSHGPITWIEPPVENSLVKLREKTVLHVESFMRSLYMKNIITIDVPGAITYLNDIDADIIREALRIIRYNQGDTFVFKSVTKDISMYCILDPINEPSTPGGPKLVITTIACGPNMVIGHSYAGVTEPYYYLSDTSGPVVIGKDMKKVEDYINRCIRGSSIIHNDKFPILGADDDFIVYLRLSIKTMRKKFNDENMHLSPRPCHTPMELYAVKELYKADKRSNGVPLQGIFEWKFKGSIQDIAGYDAIQKGRIVSSLHTDDNPLVDLSERSFRSIIRYVEKNGYMFPDEYEGLKKYVNMTECVSGSRYGSSFIYPLQVNGEIINSQLVFAIQENNGCLMLDIPYGGICFILSVLFDNLDKFNLYGNIITIDLSATVLDYDVLPSSADEGDQLVPVEFRELSDILKLIHKICALFITIFERPTRTRVICETRKREPGVGNPSDEKNYVIRRIMKSASEAKAYIKTMSGQYKDREYTMKTWPRVGHTRQLKSGRIIYISECECHRHLPLSDKNIHLKL